MKILASTAAGLTILTAAMTAHGALVVGDDFNSYSDNSFLLGGSGTLVADGGGGNALQISGNTGAGGFFAPGVTWSPTIQPGPGGPNTSTDLAEYTVSFSITYTSAYTPNVEIWTLDGPRFADPSNNANLYGAGGFTTGVAVPVSFTMESPITTTPNGATGGNFSPTTDSWLIQLNMIDFGAPADTEASFTIDNFRVDVVPEPSSSVALLGSLGLLVLRRRRN